MITFNFFFLYFDKLYVYIFELDCDLVKPCGANKSALMTTLKH